MRDGAYVHAEVGEGVSHVNALSTCAHEHAYAYARAYACAYARECVRIRVINRACVIIHD